LNATVLAGWANFQHILPPKVLSARSTIVKYAAGHNSSPWRYKSLLLSEREPLTSPPRKKNWWVTYFALEDWLPLVQECLHTLFAVGQTGVEHAKRLDTMRINRMCLGAIAI
jgi:hypothetical protein